MRLSDDLPVVIEIVDTRRMVSEFLEVIDPVIGEGPGHGGVRWRSVCIGEEGRDQSNLAARSGRSVPKPTGA